MALGKAHPWHTLRLLWHAPWRHPKADLWDANLAGLRSLIELAERRASRSWQSPSPRPPATPLSSEDVLLRPPSRPALQGVATPLMASAPEFSSCAHQFNQRLTRNPKPKTLGGLRRGRSFRGSGLDGPLVGLCETRSIIPSPEPETLKCLHPQPLSPKPYKPYTP